MTNTAKIEDETPRERIERVARKLGLTMTAVFVPFSQSRNKDEKHPSLKKLRNALGEDGLQRLREACQDY